MYTIESLENNWRLGESSGGYSIEYILKNILNLENLSFTDGKLLFSFYRAYISWDAPKYKKVYLLDISISDHLNYLMIDSFLDYLQKYFPESEIKWSQYLSSASPSGFTPLASVEISRHT